MSTKSKRQPATPDKAKFIRFDLRPGHYPEMLAYIQAFDNPNLRIVHLEMLRRFSAFIYKEWLWELEFLGVTDDCAFYKAPTPQRRDMISNRFRVKMQDCWHHFYPKIYKVEIQ